MVKLTRGADRAAVTRRLATLGAQPAAVGGATTRNGAFLGTLAALLRVVAIVDALVCLYALVQGLGLVARERAPTLALLRATGAEGVTVGAVLAGAALAVALPAAVLALALERLVLAPLVGHLAAGYADLAPRSSSGQAALVARRAGAARRRGGRLGRAPGDGAPPVAGAEGGVMRGGRRPVPSPLLAARAAAAASDCAVPSGPGRVDRCAARRGRTPTATGVLSRGPGEPLRDRTDLAAPIAPGRTLATPRDPHRRPRARRGVAGASAVPRPPRRPFSSTFRPQEALSSQVLDAAVRSVNAARPDAVARHRRPHRQRAGQRARRWRAPSSTAGRADPDSGAPGYQGVQAADDPDPAYYRPDVDPPRHPGLLDAAQRPFRAPGLTGALVRGARQPRPARRRRGRAHARDRRGRGRRRAPRPRPTPGSTSPRRENALTPQLVDRVLSGGLPGATAARSRPTRRAAS